MDRLNAKCNVISVVHFSYEIGFADWAQNIRAFAGNRFGAAVMCWSWP